MRILSVLFVMLFLTGCFFNKEELAHNNSNIISETENIVINNKEPKETIEDKDKLDKIEKTPSNNGFTGTSIDTNDLKEIRLIMDGGDYKKAEKMYLIELEKEPAHEGLKEGLGYLYLTIGENEKAKQYISQDDIELFQNSFDFSQKLKEIRLIMDGGDYEKAEKMYLFELDKHPSNIGIKEGLGYLYLAMGDKEKAKIYISESIVDGFTGSLDTSGKINEIRLIVEKGDFVIAEKMYLEELEKEPEHNGFKEGLGHLYLLMGEKEKAKQYISVDVVDGLDGKSYTEKKLNDIKLIMDELDFVTAEKMYLEELEKEPEHNGFKEGLGHLYLLMGEKEKAKKYISVDDSLND